MMLSAELVDVRPVTSFRDFGLVAYIRTLVFIDEQACPPLEEFDDQDDTAQHYLGWVKGQPVVTCRVLLPGDGVAKIGRIATIKDHRKNGYALDMLKQMIASIDDKNVRVIKLSAQVQAAGLYVKMGFQSYGNEYMEAGIPHVMMRKNLG